MLRIDLAGEVAASRIYEGQKSILRQDPETQSLLNVYFQTTKITFAAYA